MSRSNNRTALVIGAAGGIGGATAAALFRHGWTVRGLTRRPQPDSAAITWIEGDAMNEADVLAAAQGVSLIVHAANPPGYRNWATLVLPMIDNSIAAARAAGARIVLPGTIYNFGADAFPVLRENSPQHPATRKGAIRVELENRLKAAASALHSALEAVLRPLGMTITHYACLELLAQRPGLSNSELARGAFVTRQSMNVLLQALERQGLVARPAQAPVGRALPTELTARGRRQLKMASAAVRRVEQDMLANLDASEQDQMRRLLTACIASLTEPPASAT